MLEPDIVIRVLVLGPCDRDAAIGVHHGLIGARGAARSDHVVERHVDIVFRGELRHGIHQRPHAHQSSDAIARGARIGMNAGAVDEHAHRLILLAMTGGGLHLHQVVGARAQGTEIAQALGLHDRLPVAVGRHILEQRLRRGRGDQGAVGLHHIGSGVDAEAGTVHGGAGIINLLHAQNVLDIRHIQVRRGLTRELAAAQAEGVLAVDILDVERAPRIAARPVEANRVLRSLLVAAHHVVVFGVAGHVVDAHRVLAVPVVVAEAVDLGIAQVLHGGDGILGNLPPLFGAARHIVPRMIGVARHATVDHGEDGTIPDLVLRSLAIYEIRAVDRIVLDRERLLGMRVHARVPIVVGEQEAQRLLDLAHDEFELAVGAAAVSARGTGLPKHVVGDAVLVIQLHEAQRRAVLRDE